MAYEIAYEKNNAAIEAFQSVQTAYRSKAIGDAEFLAGKAIYDAAMAEYDEAFAAEQNGVSA